MAKINTISLSGNSFVDIGTDNIIGIIVSNTDNEDVTIDLVIGGKILNGTTSTTGATFVLKDIPIPVGSSFVWDDDNILSGIFSSGSTVSKYDTLKRKFEILRNNTFLIRAGSGHTADVLLKRK